MDTSLEAFWGALALIDATYKVIANPSYSQHRSAQSTYRHARFGLAENLLYSIRLVDTERLQEMHWNINHWTDEEVVA